MTSMNIEIVKIDARVADEYISRNIKTNRNVNKSRLSQLIADMNAGRFIENGDPIRFNEHGELVDGQHRLLAILATNKTYEFVVVHGLGDGAMRTIDTGYTRSAAQLLRMSNISEANHTKIAAIARSVVMYKRDRVQVSKAEVVDFTESNLDTLEMSAHLAAPCQKLFRGSIAVYGCAAFVLLEINQDDATAFFRSLAEGIGLQRGDPILALRNNLTATNPVKSGTKWGLMEGLHPIFRAWNSYRDGKTLSALRVRRDGFTAPK